MQQIIIEKPIVAEIVNKSLVFYGTQKFNAVFVSLRH
jgi:hypothetical protein